MRGAGSAERYRPQNQVDCYDAYSPQKRSLDRHSDAYSHEKVRSPHASHHSSSITRDYMQTYSDKKIYDGLESRKINSD